MAALNMCGTNWCVCVCKAIYNTFHVHFHMPCQGYLLMKSSFILLQNINPLHLRFPSLFPSHIFLTFLLFQKLTLFSNQNQSVCVALNKMFQEMLFSSLTGFSWTDTQIAHNKPGIRPFSFCKKSCCDKQINTLQTSLSGFRLLA